MPLQCYYPTGSPPIGPYSWAGHCRFEIPLRSPNDDGEEGRDEDEFDEGSKVDGDFFEGESNVSDDEEEEKDYREVPTFGLKCKKLSTNFDSEFSKYNLHSLKPIKEVYVYLRNEKIVKNMKIRRPKYVHLYSHPLKKVTSDTARKLGRLKNLKLLTFRDYGYEITEDVMYCEDGADLEECAKKGLFYEDILKLQELNYLLSSTNSLRKLYVMLYCEDWEVFKRLQNCARNQKNLQGFGFISRFRGHSGLGNQSGYQYDISPLGPRLKHLEMRFDWEQARIEIKGLNKLHQLSHYTDGRTCDEFPSHEDYLYYRRHKGEDTNAGSNCFDSPLSQISQLFGNGKFETLEFKYFELEDWSEDFWYRISSILEFVGKRAVSVTFEMVLDQYKKCKNLLRRIQEQIDFINFQGAVQILILDNFTLSTGGHGLKTDRFNFDKQYLFGIERYKIKRILSRSNKDASVGILDI